MFSAASLRSISAKCKQRSRPGQVPVKLLKALDTTYEVLNIHPKTLFWNPTTALGSYNPRVQHYLAVCSSVEKTCILLAHCDSSVHSLGTKSDVFPVIIRPSFSSAIYKPGLTLRWDGWQYKALSGYKDCPQADGELLPKSLVVWRHMKQKLQAQGQGEEQLKECLYGINGQEVRYSKKTSLAPLPLTFTTNGPEEMVNALQMDCAYINGLTRLPESETLCICQTRWNARSLLLAYKTTWLGRRVVLQNCSNINNFKFSIKDFMQGVTNTTKAQVALDFPLSQMGLPDPLQILNPSFALPSGVDGSEMWGYGKLDNGISVGFNQTHQVVDVGGMNLPPDTLLVGSWGLLYQVAIVTYLHHNADGACTWVMPYNRCKIWTCIKVKTPFDYKKLTSFYATLTNRDNALSDFEDNIECETIYQYAGDLVSAFILAQSLTPV
ncbi:hypothetical protein OG21DRAFT_1527002 [Imleria badia]|nr:hypothetical protein OG21DRAFT_1527002 [Imleria badia]